MPFCWILQKRLITNIITRRLSWKQLINVYILERYLNVFFCVHGLGLQEDKAMMAFSSLAGAAAHDFNHANWIIKGCFLTVRYDGRGTLNFFRIAHIQKILTF